MQSPQNWRDFLKKEKKKTSTQVVKYLLYN